LLYGKLTYRPKFGALADRFSANRKTLHKTEAQFISRFGWGLTRRIEEYGVNKFKVNIEKVRTVESFRRMVANASFLAAVAPGAVARDSCAS
jgi:hypothetical protein